MPNGGSEKDVSYHYESSNNWNHNHSKLVLSVVLANQKLLSAGSPNGPRHFGQTSALL